MPTQETIRFTSEGCRLVGTLHLPDKKNPQVVIGCHGLLADRSSPKQIALGEALNRVGIAYLRFDHRGCGESEGRLDLANLLSERCSDLFNAIDFILGRPELGGLLGLFGSSFGGTVALAAAAARPVPFLVSYAAPVHSRSVGASAGQEIRVHQGISEQELAGLAFDIRSELPLLRSILVMHGGRDEIVPPQHAHLVFASAGEPKKLILFDEGDHRLTRPDYQQRFLEECLAWFNGLSPA